jgi:hypothetical protein
MSTAVPKRPHFLVEWYRPDVADEVFDHNLAKLVECADSLSAGGAPVQLLVTLTVPCDEVAFAVFHAGSAQTVAQVCHLAGIPAQRLTPAISAHFPSPNHRETPDSSQGFRH